MLKQFQSIRGVRVPWQHAAEAVAPTPDRH